MTSDPEVWFAEIDALATGDFSRWTRAADNARARYFLKTHVLDTNACIAPVDGSPLLVRRRFTDGLAARARIATSTIAIYELWYGVAKSAREAEDAARLDAFLTGPLETIAFDDEDSKIAGSIRARLERFCMPIGAYDTLIAAQALRRNAILVTANVSEFERIDGLRVEVRTL